MDNQINMNGAVSSQTTPGGVGNPAIGGMLNMRYGPGVPASMAAAMGQLGQMGFPGQPPAAMGSATAVHPGHPAHPHQPQGLQHHQQQQQQQQHNPAMLFHQQLMSPGGGGWALHNTASQLSQALGSPPMQTNPLMSVAEQQQHPKTVPQSQIDANSAIVFAQLSAMASQAHQQSQQLQIQPQPHPHVQPRSQTSVGLPQSQQLQPQLQQPQLQQPQQQQQQQMMMQHNGYSLLMHQLHQQPEHIQRAAMVAALSTQQQYQQYAMPPPPVPSLAGQTKVTPHSTPPTASSTPALNSAALPIAPIHAPMKTTVAAAAASQQHHPKQQQQQPLQGVTISDSPAANGLAGVSAGAVSDNAAANSVNPSLPPSLNMSAETNMATGGNGIGGRAESTVSSSSPALSTGTRKSRASPKAQQPKKNSKETKRKGGAKKDSRSTAVAAAANVRTTSDTPVDASIPNTAPSRPAQTQSQNQAAPASAPPAPKRARSRSVAVAAPISLVAPVPTAAVGSEPDSAKTLSSEAEQLPPPLMPSHTSLSSAAAAAPSVKFSTQPTRAPRSSTVIPLPYEIDHLHTEQDILGSGVERLLAFHGDLTDSVRDLEKWNSTVAKHFSSDGTLRLDLGTQSFDIPVSTTGRFYQQLFNEGGVSSIHVALGPAKVHRLRHAASLISFHGVMITSTYSGGRRVIETGSLRVIFTPDYHIRVWAFSAADATICLPRKRPNAQDDAMTRNAESTIGRNLEWPNTSALPPKRRKSAHGRQPPEECVLPPAALRHAEVASTMHALRDLIDIQAQNPSKPVAAVLKMWASAEKVAVEATSSKSSASAGERRRPRKRSIQASMAPTSTARPASDNAAVPSAEKPATSDKPVHLVSPAATESAL
ncbi:hypothetical protein LPJ53_001490 [Coemansia erecta]|uniref:LIM-domain binding protein-domain-containing protein n=1 Tax=Coemansia erecta TaxID=147472 RepID=A0A9W7Y694_9FUNG|nr:hypothetical protein LPJ53_001490 [Coemansia erecta]